MADVFMERIFLPKISTVIFFFIVFIGSTSSVMNMQVEAADNLPPLIVMSREEMVKNAGYGEEKLSSVLVTGTLVCDTCQRRQPGVEALTSSIAGALVGVTCKMGTGKRSKMVKLAKGRTDEYGDFIIDLPSHLHATPKLQESCMVRILGTPKASPCRRHDLPGRSRRMILSSVGTGIRTYTTGTIRLQRHLAGSSICKKKLREYYTRETDTRVW